eukprot:9436130-Pyramimonas_sp.AAC.1
MRMFERLRLSQGIVATQEAHGHPGEIDHPSMQPPSHIFGSAFSPDSVGAGGLIAAIRKKFASHFWQIGHRPLIEGRMLLTELAGPHGQRSI